MTDQPPEQPLDQPSGHPAQQPGQGDPATQPMPSAANVSSGNVPSGNVPSGNAAAAMPQAAPKPNVWHRTTSTHGGRWAIAIAAGALAFLMLLGIGVAGFLVLRNHDRFGIIGQRQDRFFGGQLGHGNGRGPGGNGMPGLRGGRAQGLGELGGLLGGTALHGNVTASVNGAAQALTFQRGQVTAVSATSITLTSSDGFVGTYGRTNATNSMMAAPVVGGQAFVLARASDKVAITILSTPANGGVGPTS